MGKKKKKKKISPQLLNAMMMSPLNTTATATASTFYIQILFHTSDATAARCTADACRQRIEFFEVVYGSGIHEHTEDNEED
mmetsp:Transcript_18642/g.31413  ORF Transcript_18642/g.31413 Transcript_18642/m.31413 type:complete len:81 (-) Transcript_18642:641-883(-)